MTKKSKGSMTLAEHEAQLKAEGKWDEFVSKKNAMEQARVEKADQIRLEEEPILSDLREVGLYVNSVWDLVNAKEPYPEAIPVLLAHLVQEYPIKIGEGIARALAVKEARPAWPILVHEYCRAPTSKVENVSTIKEGLAVALCATVTASTLQEYIEIIKDSSHGKSRVLLLSALRKSRNPLAHEALEELKNDPDLKIEISSWKKKSRR